MAKPFEAASSDAGFSTSRRGFLIGAAGAGLVFAFARPGDLLGADADTAVAAGAFEPTIWYRIGPQGDVLVNIIRAEMGQHVGTALARIVADELEADWNRVTVKYVDSDPKWGVMVTGGSWSVSTSFVPLSQAGAAGRIALIEAGAKLLGVPTSACIARNGAVVAGKRSIGYGEIVTRARPSRTFTADELGKLPLKPPSERRLIGLETRALDIPDKTTGKTIYGIDVDAPGAVYARPKVPPTRNGSKVVSVDDSAAKAIKGYRQSLVLDDPSGTVPGWVMVLADTWMAALRAADKVQVTWQNDDTAQVSEQDIQNHAGQLIDDASKGVFVFNDDGFDAAFERADKTYEERYTTSSVLHFQLEPVNTLAFVEGGVWQIHCGNQWQSLILPVLAKALGVDADKVIIRQHYLGGGFGRRLNGDYTVPVALASKALGGKPVKMIATRADDSRFDSFRSPSVQRVRMAFDAEGKVTAMQHDACAGWPTQVMAEPLLAKGLNGVYDSFALAGADSWYDLGAQRVRALSNDLANRAFRPGWLRSVGPGWTNWASESFLDEVAHARGLDPVEWRLALLDAKGRNAGSAPNSVGGAHRQAAVVKRAAEKGGWGAKMPADTGLGFATTFGQERGMPTWVACVARVRVDRGSGAVRVEKLTLVCDAGTIVHPDGALAQMQGASLWGISMALHEGTRFENGQVADTNLDTYTPLRMGDVPELDIEFIASTEAAVGLGEPATTVVAPAIANAIFAAVGARLRHLPMRPADVLAALKSAGKSAAA